MDSDEDQPNDGKHQNNNQKNRNSKFRAPKTENLKRGRIIVRNLSFKVKDNQLMEHFKTFGEISEMNVLKKPDGKLVGCAFIQYVKYEDAVKAIQKMNGTDYLKRNITVDFAVSKNRYDNNRKPEDMEIEQLKTEEVKEEDEEDEIKEESVDEKPEIKSEDEEDDYSDEDGDDSDQDMNEPKEEEEDEEDEKKAIVKRNDDEDHEFTIFVKNLSFDTTNEDLLECFRKFGPVKYALVVKDQTSGHSKGSGFIKFLKKESANLGLQQTGLLQLQNNILDIYPTLPKKKIQALDASKKKVEIKDGRHLYLLREGMVMAGSSAADGVSATDMSKRLRLEQIKSSMLKNLTRFLSRERLTIHNIPENFDDDKLRKLVQARTNTNPNECRIMRENQPTPEHPKGKPKGFGFLSFKRHEEALNVLRKLNNNPEVFSANHRPIVSFSIEDLKVLNIKENRLKRSLLNNPTYQKKMEKNKIKKAKKRLERKDKKKPIAPMTATATVKATPAKVEENPSKFSGFASKPGGVIAKSRGTNKLKEQSKIHEKSTQQRRKLLKKEKQANEIRKEKLEKRQEVPTKKRKIDAATSDSLTKMIDKYKNIIKGNTIDGVPPAGKRVKGRGKWFMD